MNTSQIIKYRLRSGSEEIIEDLEGISVEELIFTTYLPIKDEDTRRLVRFFDEQLVLAKVRPELFIETRYQKIMEIVRWIRENHKYRIFSDFSAYVFRNINMNMRILVPYQCCLIEVWGQISPLGQWWYGFDERDNPLFMDELFPSYDIDMWKLREKMRQRKVSNDYVYQKEREIELKTRNERNNDRNISNIIYQMLGLITTENQSFIFPFKDWFNHGYIKFDFPRIYKDSEYYLGLLNQRSYLLNSEGVIVKIFNAGMFGEIRFLEQFLEDGMIVLYRVTHAQEGKHSMGFIDLRNGFVYSPFDYVNIPKEYQSRYKNFVLEIYTTLTSPFPKDIKRFMALREFKSPDDELDLYPEQPGIYCVVKEVINASELKHHSSHKVTERAYHNVHGHLRKGNPSEMALVNARIWGLIVPPGYTFVRPHTRGKIKSQVGDEPC